MWRPKDDEVEIQIIDFEDALMLGSVVDKALAQIYSNDVRYPIRRGTDCSRAIIAKVEFNKFFADAIKAWLEQTEDKEFRTFMTRNELTMTYFD